VTISTSSIPIKQTILCYKLTRKSRKSKQPGLVKFQSPLWRHHSLEGICAYKRTSDEQRETLSEIMNWKVSQNWFYYHFFL